MKTSIKTTLKTLATVMLLASPAALAEPKSGPTPEADAKFAPLVPQLGDKGPQFSVVFGDLKKKNATSGQAGCWDRSRSCSR